MTGGLAREQGIGTRDIDFRTFARPYRRARFGGCLIDLVRASSVTFMTRLGLGRRDFVVAYGVCHVSSLFSPVFWRTIMAK